MAILMFLSVPKIVKENDLEQRARRDDITKDMFTQHKLVAPKLALHKLAPVVEAVWLHSIVFCLN